DVLQLLRSRPHGGLRQRSPTVRQWDRSAESLPPSTQWAERRGLGFRMSILRALRHDLNPIPRYSLRSLRSRRARPRLHRIAPTTQYVNTISTNAATSGSTVFRKPSNSVLNPCPGNRLATPNVTMVLLFINGRYSTPMLTSTPMN